MKNTAIQEFLAQFGNKMIKEEFHELTRQSQIWAEEWTIWTTLMVSAAIALAVGFVWRWWVDKKKR